MNIRCIILPKSVYFCIFIKIQSLKEKETAKSCKSSNPKFLLDPRRRNLKSCVCLLKAQYIFKTIIIARGLNCAQTL